MKKLILLLLLATFSLGTFAQINPQQDTTTRKKHKTIPVKKKRDTVNRDTTKKWPEKRDTTRKKY